MALTPVARSSLSDAVFEQLSSEIVSGALSPGDTLPAERELVAVLGVNRGAVREALKRLVQAGLVDVRHGGGATVLDYARSGGLDLLPRLLFGGDGSVRVEVARSVMEMREALGPQMARRCAQRRGADHLRDMRAALAQMRDSPDDLEVLSVHALELWQQVVDGSGNVAYQLAFNALRTTYEEIRGALVLALREELVAVDTASALVDAVAARRSRDAEQAAARWLRLGSRGMERVLAQLEASS
ncbi:MAG: GntR family transcriptional regulator [Myxococcales bacterium]|nr:GntR family transcriptional regulator [Myxococcales bacterium]